MHELSIASAVVNTAIRHANGKQVTVVNLRLGALRQVVPDSLEFYFEIVSRETQVEGAKLELEAVSALLRCAECGTEWDPAPPPMTTHELAEGTLDVLPSFRCECGAAGAAIIRGDELEVDSIEIDDANKREEACIGPR